MTITSVSTFCECFTFQLTIVTQFCEFQRPFLVTVLGYLSNQTNL